MIAIGDAVVVVSQDVTERRLAQAALERMALHDPLTGLPNSRYLYTSLEQQLVRCERDKQPLSIVVMDLDGFKKVNDTAGHEAGDHLLRIVAQRLSACVRQSDTLARLGGDEFAVLITALERTGDAVRVVEKVQEQLNQPYLDLDGHELEVSPSIGVALYPRDGQDIDTLSKLVDSIEVHQ